MELLGALEAEKLTKQKCKQYCGTPCKLFQAVTAMVISTRVMDNAERILISVGCFAMWTSQAHARMCFLALLVLCMIGLARLVETKIAYHIRLVHAWLQSKSLVL